MSAFNPIASTSFGYTPKFNSISTQSATPTSKAEAMLEAFGDKVNISDEGRQLSAGTSTGLSATTMAGTQVSVESRQTGQPRFAMGGTGNATQDAVRRGFAMSGQQSQVAYAVTFIHADGSTQRFELDGVTRFEQLGNGRVAAVQQGQTGKAQEDGRGSMSQGILINVQDGAEVQGGAGDDLVLNAGRGARIETGEGADTVISMGDGVSVDGGAGDDRISLLKDTMVRPTKLADTAKSQSLVEQIMKSGDSSVFGEAKKYEDNEGNAVKTADAQTVNIKGGDGNDTIDARATLFGSSIDAGDGNDIIRTEDVVRSTIKTGNGTNKLDMGVVLASTVEGGSGDDTINARLIKNSTVRGNAGNDVMTFMGVQNSLISAGEGDDTMRIEESRHSRIQGDAGNDTLQVGIARGSSVLGGTGDDNILTGELIDSRVDGEDGNDSIIFDSAVNSEILGGKGDDSIERRGTAGADKGWWQNSRADGGAGNNSVELQSSISA